MSSFISLLKDIFMIKQDDSMKVGLSQFRRVPLTSVRKEVPAKNKEVKLSDLMRRA